MNLFGFNLSLSRNQKSKIETQKSLSPEAGAWLRGDDSGSQRGTTLANAYEQSVWVYRAINVLAEQVANIPFLFSHGERGRENLITGGPLHDFYAHPNPYVNRFQYWELRVIWLMLRGECFRVPIYEDGAGASPSPGGEGRGEGGISALDSLASSSSSAGRPPSPRGEGRGEGEFSGPHSLTHSLTGSLTPRRKLKNVLILDPAHFQHIVENGQLVGWRYTGLGPNAPLESQVFLPEEVWFEKLPNPFDCWRGLPPLYVAGMATKTDFAAGAFMQGLMENNHRPRQHNPENTPFHTPYVPTITEHCTLKTEPWIPQLCVVRASAV